MLLLDELSRPRSQGIDRKHGDADAGKTAPYHQGAAGGLCIGLSRTWAYAYPVGPGYIVAAFQGTFPGRVWVRGDGVRCLRRRGALVFLSIRDAEERLEPYRGRKDLLTPSSYMVLDISTRRNLELTESIRSQERKGSLLWLLDRTGTAMGGRMLKKWVQQPPGGQSRHRGQAGRPWKI